MIKLNKSSKWWREGGDLKKKKTIIIINNFKKMQLPELVQNQINNQIITIQLSNNYNTTIK